MVIPANVVKMSSFNIQGAHVPLTMEGNIVVDRVLASCYADFDHDLAHFTMKPIQLFPHIMECIFGENTGFPLFVSMARELGMMMLPYGQYFS